MPEAVSADGHRHIFPDGTPPDVIDRVMKDYARNTPQPPAAWVDFLQSLPRGMMKGFFDLVSNYAAAEQQQAEALAPVTAAEKGLTPMPRVPVGGEAAVTAIEGETGYQLPKPAGRAGKFGEAIGETLGDPVTYLGPGSLPLKVASGTLGAVGSEAAGELFKGTRYETPARIVVGMVSGTAPAVVSMERTLARLGGQLPTHADIHETASNLYNALDRSHVTLSPEGAGALSHEIHSALEEDNFRRYLEPKTFRALDELMGIREDARAVEQQAAARGRAAVGSLTTESTPAEIASARAATVPAVTTTSVGEIDTTRKLLVRITRTGEGSEREAARRAIEAIDAFLMNVPDHFVISGNPRRDAEALREAQRLWATHKQMELVEQALTTGEHRAAVSGTGANRINTARQEIRKILDSEKKSRGLSPEVRDQMERIIMGTWLSNRLRWASKFAPTGPVSATADVVVGKGLGPGVGAPLVLGGFLGKALGEYLTDRQLRQLFELMRAQSPLGERVMRQISPLMQQARTLPAAQAVRSGLAPLAQSSAGTAPLANGGAAP